MMAKKKLNKKQNTFRWSTINKTQISLIFSLPGFVGYVQIAIAIRKDLAQWLDHLNGVAFFRTWHRLHSAGGGEVFGGSLPPREPFIFRGTHISRD